MRKPTEFERELSRFVRSQFGGNTKATRYGDDSGQYDMFLAMGEDVPTIGVRSYGTVGLSLVAQRFHDNEVFVELLGACAADTADFGNLMSSCVFESTKNGSSIVYGGCLENILDQYEMSTTLRHVTFVAPFLWDGFGPRTVLGKEIHWLQALPISESELDFLVENGIDELENRFEQVQIDVYNINRASAV